MSDLVTEHRSGARGRENHQHASQEDRDAAERAGADHADGGGGGGIHYEYTTKEIGSGMLRGREVGEKKWRGEGGTAPPFVMRLLVVRDGPRPLSSCFARVAEQVFCDSTLRQYVHSS